jgi:hypothetical protein
MSIPTDEDDDFDPIEEDCGPSTVLDKNQARQEIRHYNQILEERFKFKKNISRFNPSHILHGLD